LARGLIVVIYLIGALGILAKLYCAKSAQPFLALLMRRTLSGVPKSESTATAESRRPPFRSVTVAFTLPVSLAC
jgi:hypothetical protein